MKRHAFSYKKPVTVPGKASKEQQEQWIAEYEKLKRNLPENETIGFDETLNAESTLKFLRKIEEAYPTKDRIHIFCDNARYYWNAEIGEYLKKSKITLHFLPPYSPNLNPIERLWKWMKERILYNNAMCEFSAVWQKLKSGSIFL